MKIHDLLIAEEIQTLEELKLGKYAHIASILGTLAAQHGGKAADVASIGYKQQAPHALATLATYADPKRLSALPATLSSNELNKDENEFKRQKDKKKIGRLIPSLKEGYVKPGASKESLHIPSLGARFTFYWDHIFYVDNKFDLSIYREGVFKPPRNNEVYLKDAARLGIDKSYFQIFSAWLTTPRDKLQGLWPNIIAALEHIAANRNKDQKENTMRMDDISEGGNPQNKIEKKRVMAALNPSPRKKPETKTPDMRDVISGVRRGRKVAAEGIEDKDLANVHPSKFGDEGEYGMEGDYVKNQLNTMIRVMTHLKNALGDEEDLPEWVEEKVSQAKGMMVSVMDYVISEKERTIEKAKGKEVTMDEGKKKGTDGKACWNGYRFGGTENGKDKCIKVKKKKK